MGSLECRSSSRGGGVSLLAQEGGVHPSQVAQVKGRSSSLILPKCLIGVLEWWCPGGLWASRVPVSERRPRTGRPRAKNRPYHSKGYADLRVRPRKGRAFGFAGDDQEEAARDDDQEQADRTGWMCRPGLQDSTRKRPRKNHGNRG